MKKGLRGPFLCFLKWIKNTIMIFFSLNKLFNAMMLESPDLNEQFTGFLNLQQGQNEWPNYCGIKNIWSRFFWFGFFYIVLKFSLSYFLCWVLTLWFGVNLFLSALMKCNNPPPLHHAETLFSSFPITQQNIVSKNEFNTVYWRVWILSRLKYK